MVAYFRNLKEDFLRGCNIIMCGIAMDEQEYMQEEIMSYIAEKRIVQYFEKNCIHNNDIYYINYPPNFPWPIKANSAEELFDKFLDILKNEQSEQ